MRGVLPIVLSMGLLFASTVSVADNKTLNDATLTTKVKTALISNKDTKASQINVETQKGVVQLSGFVDSQEMRDAAVTTARNVTGVIDVQNKLLIRDADRTTGQAVDDTVIAARVKSELAGQSGLGTAADVNVEVNSGVVSLSGFVPTMSQKTQAAEIARSVDGVVDVRNNLELKPKS